MGYASGRTTEIPRDTERYQEIPFGRRYPNGIPLVSLGISWYLCSTAHPRDTKRYQEIPKDTKGIPLVYRLPNGISCISWYLYLLVSLGISWYLLVSLHISCLVSLTDSSLLSWYISLFFGRALRQCMCNLRRAHWDFLQDSFKPVFSIDRHKESCAPEAHPTRSPHMVAFWRSHGANAFVSFYTCCRCLWGKRALHDEMSSAASNNDFQKQF